MSARFLRTRPWIPALIWLAVLTPLFFASYRFANWVTSLRPNVPSADFAWERHIPFVPWTIVPYWSTDLLYGLSLFLCRTREELNTHGKRLLTAQLVSVTVFLLIPLRFGFPRPAAEGPWAGLFAALYGFDKPFNQAPSLHLCLTVILWSLYSRHLRGVLLWGMRLWMILVGISTLTTYQHHFIDLPAGVWVGLLVTALFPFEKVASLQLPSPDPRRFRLAANYLVGAALPTAAAIGFRGAGWLLLWPAGSLLLVAAIYASGDPGFFRKRDGAISAPVAGLLGPYLVAARWNLLWWSRRDGPAQEIDAGVWLGRWPQRQELDRMGILSLVDLTAELSIDTAGLRYRPVPMLDRLVPSADQLEAAVEAIESVADARPTLVCCAAGYSRSAAAVAAWLLATGRTATVGEAIAWIRARRSGIVLTSADQIRLEEWRSRRRETLKSARIDLGPAQERLQA